MKTPRLRCRWVVADEACGDNPSWREGGAGWGLWYGADVPPTTRVWAERPAPPSPPWRGRGRRPPRERLVEGAPEARTVREVAAALPAPARLRRLARDAVYKEEQGQLVVPLKRGVNAADQLVSLLGDLIPTTPQPVSSPA